MACAVLPPGVMRSFSSSRHFHFALVLMMAAGCSSESEPKKRDDITADSALAADLALANRDTLLIDSIGQYRPPEGAVVDTAPAPSANSPTAAPVVAMPPRAATDSARSTVSSRPRRPTGDPCNSPTLSDQQTCVHSMLAAADKRLNGVYRALLTEMRRQENIKPGGSDPPSVERLRAAQRAWLGYRDTECRRRGREKEGALWARPRVQCLGEFSVRRSNELADNFSRLTAR